MDNLNDKITPAISSKVVEIEQKIKNKNIVEEKKTLTNKESHEKKNTTVKTKKSINNYSQVENIISKHAFIYLIMLAGLVMSALLLYYRQPIVVIKHVNEFKLLIKISVRTMKRSSASGIVNQGTRQVSGVNTPNAYNAQINQRLNALIKQQYREKSSTSGSVIAKFKEDSPHAQYTKSPSGKIGHHSAVHNTVIENSGASQVMTTLTSKETAYEVDNTITETAKFAGTLHNGKPGIQFLAVKDKLPRITHEVAKTQLEILREATAEEHKNLELILNGKGETVWRLPGLTVGRRLLPEFYEPISPFDHEIFSPKSMPKINTNSIKPKGKKNDHES